LHRLELSNTSPRQKSNQPADQSIDGLQVFLI